MLMMKAESDIDRGRTGTLHHSTQRDMMKKEKEGIIETLEIITKTIRILRDDLIILREEIMALREERDKWRKEALKNCRKELYDD